MRDASCSMTWAVPFTSSPCQSLRMHLDGGHRILDLVRQRRGHASQDSELLGAFALRAFCLRVLRACARTRAPRRRSHLFVPLREGRCGSGFSMSGSFAARCCRGRTRLRDTCHATGQCEQPEDEQHRQDGSDPWPHCGRQSVLHQDEVVPGLQGHDRQLPRCRHTSGTSHLRADRDMTHAHEIRWFWRERSDPCGS